MAKEQIGLSLASESVTFFLDGGGEELIHARLSSKGQATPGPDRLVLQYALYSKDSILKNGGRSIDGE